jgi:hypothetical protein
MRLLAFLLLTGSLVVVGCAGDSSSLMSVWNDSGVGGAPSPVGGAGGSGGAGGAGAGGTVLVPGGVRDLSTAQCISTTGGGCLYSSDNLACLKGNCAPYLSACYSQPGTSTSAGGVCLEYANCLLRCPCDGSQSTCESDCGQNYLSMNNCWMCIVNLGTCASNHNCQMPTCNSGAALGLP